MNSKPIDQNSVPPAAGKREREREHVWTHGADVQSLWRKFGWTPPSQSRRDYSKPDRTDAQPAHD